MPFGSKFIEQMADFIIWYAKNKTDGNGNAIAKYRKLFTLRSVEGEFHHCWYEDSNGIRNRMSKYQLYNHSLLPPNSRVYRLKSLEPSGRMESGMFDYEFRGKLYRHPKNGFGTTLTGMKQLEMSNRLEPEGNRLCYVLYADEGESSQMTAPWADTVGADDKQYVVQTNSEVVKRCILMTTDPGDLVLDPTCGSGTSAFVSENWGRRWITMDTSRVALALARARIMGARFPFFLLADTRQGQAKVAEIKGTSASSQSVNGDIRHGFVYEQMPRITVGMIANNSAIELIWTKWRADVDLAVTDLNSSLKADFKYWEIPDVPDHEWSDTSRSRHLGFLKLRRSRQMEIDAAIARSAESTSVLLYDRPHEDRKTVRVAGPFTVESLSPHRMMGVDEDGELIDTVKEANDDSSNRQSFPQMILDNLKTAGVQQAHKDDRISFTSLTAWPGEGAVCAEGHYMEGEVEKRAGIFIGPEFGTVQRSDLVAAARECGEAGFDVLIACAFNYEAHATEFSKLGRIPVLKARMNADLHMAEDLKNTGKGNLFVIFGEPDIDILSPEGKNLKVVVAGKESYPVAAGGKLVVKVNGVDVFKPQTGEVISDGADGIACWFIDTDYNEESFFVRHAYFLGANDPYSSLKTTLKAEIDKEAWDTLNSDTSRPFDKPKSGRIAVKVINHLGDEVMRVFRVA
jgi:adenine-specific DNA-methyltransferase